MFCSGINITAVNYSWGKSLVSKFGEILPSGSGKTSYRFGEILVSFLHFAESSNFTLAGSGPSPCLIINGRTQLGKRMHSYFVLRFVTAR